MILLNFQMTEASNSLKKEEQTVLDLKYGKQ